MAQLETALRGEEAEDGGRPAFHLQVSLIAVDGRARLPLRSQRQTSASLEDAAGTAAAPDDSGAAALGVARRHQLGCHEAAQGGADAVRGGSAPGADRVQ